MTEVGTTAATSAQDWAGIRVVPGVGGGTLARVGPVVLLIGSTDPEVIRPYVDQAMMVAANGGQGRQLVRGYALMLSTAVEQSPGFAALAPHTTGLAVFIDGDVTVEIDGQTISGAESLAWVERLIPWPVDQVAARLPGATPPPDAASGPFHLDLGVVPAGSFAARAGAAGTDGTAGAMAPAVGADAPAPVSDETGPLAVVPATPPAPAAPAPAAPAAHVPAAPAAPAPDPAPVPEPAPAAEAAPAPVAPGVPVPAAVPDGGGRPLPPPQADEHVDFQSVLISEVDEEDEFEPLPIVESADQVAPAVHEDDKVRGVRCKNRHFNDPRQLFCAVCGINMVQQTPVLATGVRPPLGVLVIDDGSVFQLDNAYLLGREPDVDERVQSGRYRSLPVIDQSHQVSRVHARLELRGWDVVLIDNNSTNGTYVHVPGALDWQRLAPGGEHVLVQGTRVRIGHRTLAFNTHAGGKS